MNYSRRQGGQAVLGGVIFFLAGALTVVSAVASPVLRDTRAVRNVITSKASYTSAEGALEDALYRNIAGKTIANPVTIAIGSSSVTVSAQDVADERIITAVSTQENRVRKVTAHLFQGQGASFNYGVQTDTGGIVMQNSSTVQGNVYSNGPVTGSNSNLVKGTVVSAGPTGVIDGINATSSAYAHTIKNSDIDGDAYYQIIQSSNIGGASHPGSDDQATTSLPITDAQIATWESDAAAGGTISSPCPYQVTGSVTLGPKKIDCDMQVSGSATITLTGPVWVAGDISFSNSAAVHIAASAGNKSVAIIADDPSDQATGSTISLQNSADFQGNGGSRSFVLLISQNRSAEQGGGTQAISVQNYTGGSSGDLLLYARHGEIGLQNNISLAEVSGWRIRLENSAEVVYRTGLANLLFTSGPSGGYSIDYWQETQ